MNELDLIIKDGDVVLPEKVHKTDLGIKDGKIVQIKENITDSAKQVLQAKNLFVFPGMIDVHVHFNDPGREEWEGFQSGSYMMAAGGCTTYFDMPLNGIPSTTTEEALFEKVNKAEQTSSVDFGLWGGLVPGNKHQLAKLANAGVIGFKAFLSASGNKEFEAADDQTLINGMNEIAKLEKVLALHAESRTITDFLTEQKKINNQLSADDYAETRPIIAEVEAVERAIFYAEITNCPLHFVHISSSKAIEKIQQAKQRGLNISIETCPHYLLFNHTDLVEKGAVAKCAPPLRSETEQTKLIQLLIDGKIDIVSSDHSPSPFELKDPEKHHLLSAWGGISGGQFTLLSMIELAITHDIPFEQLVKWTSSNPAQRFNLPSKGEIKIGMDADIAIVDLKQSTKVTPKTFYAKHKQSLYMDRTFPCRIIKTYSRGNLVYDQRQQLSQNVNGQWIK
ncbi:allantoinase [Aquibacillus rhizosphaerae]|uniref:Allantoinase n=1 Tax=Aquibacillus rhizosphaerae TaxID=3051431 RepID=A0ABT7L8V9_9BACI|nr:allantoinase [Aquibacillus sp. LR5S19]MDL4841015.1 allantoinase [Aquibacillus sp. LR5S19]